jgi:hypothetical protein
MWGTVEHSFEMPSQIFLQMTISRIKCSIAANEGQQIRRLIFFLIQLNPLTCIELVRLFTEYNFPEALAQQLYTPYNR